MGKVPVKVFYPNPPQGRPRRRLLPTLYNAFRLDAYGALRTVGLAKKPLSAAKAVADEACQVDPGEPKRSVNLATFILDGFHGLGMLITRQKTNPTLQPTHSTNQITNQLSSEIHHNASCVRINKSPSETAIDEFVCSPISFKATSLNDGPASNTTESPA